MPVVVGRARGELQRLAATRGELLAYLVVGVAVVVPVLIADWGLVHSRHQARAVPKRQAGQNGRVSLDRQAARRCCCSSPSTASLTDPSLARAEALQVPRSLVAFLADQLRQAQRHRATSRDIDPDKEATALVATLTSLSSGVLGNNFTVKEAAAIIDYTLDRLFQPTRAPYRSHEPSPDAR